MKSRKRKPLSDIPNKFNLTPTPVLRLLVAASSTSNLCSKPPISISKSNSSSTNLKFFSESSSRSNTSIGSSNVGATLSSKKTCSISKPSAFNLARNDLGEFGVVKCVKPWMD